MQKFYKIDDMEIIRWLKNADGTHSVRIGASDGFIEDVPTARHEGISDSTTIDELKAILKPYVEKMPTIAYSARKNVESIDMLANNN